MQYGERGDRMKSLAVKLGMILIGLIIFGSVEVRGADWKLYGTTEWYYCFYDAHSVTRSSKTIARVLVRWRYTEKGILDEMNEGAKEGQMERIAYSESSWELDCSERKHRLLSMTKYYGPMRNEVSSYTGPSEWGFTHPESMMDLYEEVCK